MRPRLSMRPTSPPTHRTSLASPREEKPRSWSKRTRVMTTAIALETSKGDLALALALGLVLIAIALAVNAAVAGLRMTSARYAYA